MFRKEVWRHFDFWLLGIVLLLCLFGIAMIRSAIAGNAELAGLDRTQTIYVGVSFAIILIVASIDYRTWKSLSKLMYGIIILMLVGINLIGEAAFGSTRWFQVGIINIQPSELAKIVVIIVLADYFSRTMHEPRDFRWIIKSFGIMAGIVVWILLQPNLSTSIVVIVIWFALLWISGLPTKYIILFGAVAILGVALFVGLVISGVKIPFIKQYQVDRVMNFLFPDPNARHGDYYNVEQALITIGSGGWFGMGYGHGTQVQLRFLKVRHTDFIFSAMAEEFGFVGTVLIILLEVMVMLRTLRIARQAPDMFGSLIAYGFSALFIFQTAVNIGVNLKIIPVTGLTLPFISYGGSSLLSLALGIGLVESIAARREPET